MCSHIGNYIFDQIFQIKQRASLPAPKSSRTARQHMIPMSINMRKIIIITIIEIKKKWPNNVITMSYVECRPHFQLCDLWDEKIYKNVYKYFDSFGN